MKENVSVLLDFEELSLNKDAFNLLLTGGEASSKEIAPADDDNDSAEKYDLEQEIGFIGLRKQPGRTPLYIKFPSLIDCAKKFIKEQSFSAHVRRRGNNRDRRGSHVEGYSRAPFGECIWVKEESWYFS